MKKNDLLSSTRLVAPLKSQISLSHIRVGPHKIPCRVDENGGFIIPYGKGHSSFSQSNMALDENGEWVHSLTSHPYRVV